MATHHDPSVLPESSEQTDVQADAKDNQLLAVRHVAQLLGIHETTVRMWADSGILESYRIGPRQDRRIPVESVRRTLEAAKRWPHYGPAGRRKANDTMP